LEWTLKTQQTKNNRSGRKIKMSCQEAKGRKPVSYQALLDKNRALQDEIEDLRARLADAEELGRAISEGDLDALVIPSPEGELIFTLDSADQAYRVLVETMNEGTATLAFDGTILYCNRRFAELLRMSLQAVVGISIYRFIAPENKLAFETLLEQERGMTEIKLLTEGGAFLPVYLSISSFQARGSPSAWCLVVTDLTEQKKNEEVLAAERLARSILEQAAEEIRKKEIHHRIKNNLQVISSLLDLQAEKFEDETVKEAFRESQNRVISMALIHEELYKGEGTDTLDFSAYLQKLAENLFQIYSFSNKNIRMCMDLEENSFFDMDTAVPLGIIVNELISNSLKYAFTEDQEGEIRIQLCREENNNEIHESLFSLTISDNGKGISEDIDIEDLESLGLQLVITLVDQLDGQIELKRAQGTEFRITFNSSERWVLPD
jgi:PAS domain S-box-containing protein